VSVLLRIGAAFYLGENFDGDQQKRIFDQVSYNALARSLIAGQGYSFEQNWYPFTPAHTPTAHWSFLYPLYLAGVYAVTGYHPLAARLFQALISGVLSIWMINRIGRRIFNEKVGLVAAGLGAIYIYFIYHDAALMTESFFILGVLAMIDLSLQLISRQGNWGKGESGNPPSSPAPLLPSDALCRRDVLYRRSPATFFVAAPLLWIGLGVVLGLTALLRQTILLWLPFLFLWIFWASRGRLSVWGPALSLGIMAIFILPWTVRNYIIYDAFLPLNSNAGYALYSANHPNHGTQFDQDYAAPLPDDLKGQALNEAQWNSALTPRGLQFILQDPRRYLLLSMDRVGIFFNFWFSSESDLSSSLMRVFSFGLYLPFFIFGLILSLRSWRRCSLIYLFAFIFSAMHILTWSSIRYRLPVDAALMPFAAFAVVHLASWLRARLWIRVKGSIRPVQSG
jgi:hypothetical protein